MRPLALVLVALTLASCSRKASTPAATSGDSTAAAPAVSSDGPQGSGFPNSVPPVDRLAALRSDSARMTRRDGVVTMGEAEVRFTAWYDADSLRVIEVDDDLGEMGHMKTTYGFDDSGVFRVQASGELRRNEPGRPNFLDPLSYAIDFAGAGGGRGSGRWGPDELTDIPERAQMALQHAALLKRAADGLRGR